MIEWLITNYHYVPASIVLSFAFTIGVLALLLSFEDVKEDTARFTLTEWIFTALNNIMIACVLAFFSSAFFMATISSKPVSSSEWKTIYSNEQNAKIELTYRTSSIEVSDEIGARFADIFSNLSDSDSKTISITASKSDYKKSEDFELLKDNLVSNGDIDKSSKIVKVEIRTADYMETNFFGFKGRNDLYQPKEVRITLESDSNKKQEVDKIFE